MGLTTGDHVRHPKWGEGTIQNVVGAGGDGLVTIDFPNVGQKMLMLKYAPSKRSSRRVILSQPELVDHSRRRRRRFG